MDARLQEILTSYLQAVDAGQAPDRDELLGQHAEFAPEPAAFLSCSQTRRQPKDVE